MPIVKRLFLLRHAKSSWDEPGLDDHDRPLAKRGRRASKTIGEHLRREGIRPDLVLCSSSVRTRETLERIGLGDGVEVRIEDDVYAAAAGELLEVLNGVGEDVGSAMVIGHNPGIQDLALQLAGDGAEIPRVRQKFPTAALATLDFDGGWDALAPGGAELISFVKPKELSRSAE
jgi:phosphohistidine phosphatase